MPVEVLGTFVSQKINKVRWIQEAFSESKCFFTGSWDDDNNSVKVWSLESQIDEEDVDYPRLLSTFPVDGDVTQIKFVEKNKIAVSISNGDLHILQVSEYDKETPLKEVKSWKSLHNYGNEKCSCTSLDTMEGDIASIGEDGVINILSGRNGATTRTISGADSCSLHAVRFVKHNEIITGNIRGHIKIWDLRSNENIPTASFLLSDDELAATCIINHPTQPHIVIAGSESGSVAMWDLRTNSYPMSLVNGHSDSVTEMQFHPENPHKLITCSVSGQIWDWNMEILTKRSVGPNNQVSHWMLLENNDKNMMVNSLMPNLHKAVNTLDCDKDRILCGADNEAVYLIKNIKY